MLGPLLTTVNSARRFPFSSCKSTKGRSLMTPRETLEAREKCLRNHSESARLRLGETAQFRVLDARQMRNPPFPVLLVPPP
jgi:hypothetical protein